MHNQLERQSSKRGVVGSSPAVGTIVYHYVTLAFHT